MNDLIIFDLEGTLVDEAMQLRVSRKQLCAFLQTNNCVCYTMAEPWTYAVLLKFSDVFNNFNRILLVKQKRIEDLELFTSDYSGIRVVGDGLDTEIGFAKSLELDAFLVTESRTITAILGELS